MVHEHSGHALGGGIVGVTEGCGGIQHEVSGLNVVAIGIVVRKRPTSIGEIEIHGAWVDADLVAENGEQLFQALTQRLILPDLVKLCEGLQQMKMRVHGLIADGEKRYGR